MEFYLELLAYFIFYSFLGWLLESVYKSIYEKRIVNSGFLYGPFCPIYGFGAIIMYLFLSIFSSNPVITFCLAFIVLSIWEYLVGIFLEKVFHRKYWDYSERKFNIQGRICILNSLFWGILGVLFIDVIHPFITRLLDDINSEIIEYAVIIISTGLLIDMIISIKNNFSIAIDIKRVEEINNNIKDKIEEIKLKGKNVEQSLQETLEELKATRTKMILKSYKRILRIKKAFPSLKSEELTQFLAEKKEFFKK